MDYGFNPLSENPALYLSSPFPISTREKWEQIHRGLISLLSLFSPLITMQLKKKKREKGWREKNWLLPISLSSLKEKKLYQVTENLLEKTVWLLKWRDTTLFPRVKKDGGQGTQSWAAEGFIPSFATDICVLMPRQLLHLSISIYN